MLRQRFSRRAVPAVVPRGRQRTGQLQRITSEAALPVDPSTDVPEGYTEDQRGVAGGFIRRAGHHGRGRRLALSPQLALAGWMTDLFARTARWICTRGSGHHSYVAVLHRGARGPGVRCYRGSTRACRWILDSDHKKMSKSKNVSADPMGILEKYGSDAVRCWAASARLGLDAALTSSGRLAAAWRQGAERVSLRSRWAARARRSIWIALVTVPLDRSVLAALASVIDEASAALAS